MKGVNPLAAHSDPRVRVRYRKQFVSEDQNPFANLYTGKKNGFLTAVFMAVSAFFRWVMQLRQLNFERLAVTRNPSLLGWCFDEALAGNHLAQRRFRRLFIVRQQDIPSWALSIMDARLDTAVRHSLKRVKGHPQFERMAQQMSDELRNRVRKTGGKQAKELAHDLEYAMIRGGFQGMLLRAERLGRVKRDDPQVQMMVGWVAQMFQKAMDAYAEATDFAYKSVVVELYFKQHPCEVTDSEKCQITDWLQHPFAILEHDLVRKALEAEAEIEDVLQASNPPLDVRGKAVRLFMKWGPTIASKRRVAKWIHDTLYPVLHERVPKPLPVVRTVSLPNAQPVRERPLDLRTMAKQYGRSLTHLEPAQQDTVTRLILTLDRQMLMNGCDVIEMLDNYTSTDHNLFLERRYHELTAVEAQDKGKPIRPVVIVTLPPLESANEILAQLDSANKVDYALIHRLRKLASNRQIPDPVELHRAMEYLICTGLAQGMRSGRHKSGSQYRIHRENVHIRLLPESCQSRGKLVVDRLIAEDKIIKRINPNKHPGLRDPVRLHPDLMPKYSRS